jgi:hypothetical protein
MELRRTSTLHILGTTKFLSMSVEFERTSPVVTMTLGVTFNFKSDNILFVKQLIYYIIY